MKRTGIKRMAQRMLSLALGFVLCAQTVPFAAITASAEGDANAAKPAAAQAAEATVEITSAEQLTGGVPAGSTYVLADDIVMGADQQMDVVAGVLDGAGHTITLSGKALTTQLTGTIQNLMVVGEASVDNGQGSIAHSVNGGTLQNCSSTVKMNPGAALAVGALVGNIENAKIYNSFFAGSATDEWGLPVNNGIFYQATNDSAPSIVKNCYFTSGSKAGVGSAWNADDKSNGKQSLKDMKTPAFVELLNATNADTGYIWAAVEGQLPKLVQAAEATVEITSADQLLGGVPAGSTYVLTDDIVMGADQQMDVVAGVLDGAGHTITLSGKALTTQLTGTIQNLMVVGEASVDNGQGSIAHSVNGGTLQNCSSTVKMNPGAAFAVGALVGNIENAKIYNSFFAGSATDEWGLPVNNGIFYQATNDSAPSTLKNCYFASGSKAGVGSAWNADDKSNGKKSLQDMKTPAFVELLNATNADTGYIWAAVEGQLPKLVQAAEATVKITSADQLLGGVPAGSTYVLANDIVMGADQQMDVVAGVLDGAGHTITLSGKALTTQLTGTIQNLMVVGEASVGEGQGSIAHSVNGGTLQNCSSTVKINPGMAFTVGGLVGNIENAKIYNSFFAGSAYDDWGLPVNNGVFCQATNDSAPSTVKNCYYTSGNNVGAGGAWNADDKSNGKKSLQDMKTPAFVELLNATNAGSGYIWEAVEGNLPKLVPGGEAVKPCDKTALEAAIQEAQAKQESDYTSESWAPMQAALDAAKAMSEKMDATQAEVDAAEKTLRDAMDALKEKVRELAPVEPPKTGVITISSKEDLARIDGNDPKKFYQLTQDIVLDGNYIYHSLSGVLDGNGHTITIHTASPILDTITETGVVQNLRVKVEGNFTNRQEFAPIAEKLRGGMIVNCVSEVTGQHSAGYVRKMEGGDMVNCLTMGHNRRGAFVFFQKSTDHRNTNGYKSGKFHNCYWSASNTVENITPAENLIDCKPVGDEELRSDAFLAQLNSQKGEFGANWGRAENGYPYFGQDHGDLVIDGSKNRYPVQFVWYDKEELSVEGGTLELSPQMTNSSRFAGTFRLQGVPEDSTITWSCNDRANQEIMQIYESGELSVFQDGGGIVRAMEHKADGTEELAAELRVVSVSREIQELRLLLDGKRIDGTATVQGSAVKQLEVQAKYKGSEEFRKLPTYLVELQAEKPELVTTDYNSAVFFFNAPGTSKLTVTEKTKKENPASITVELTSEYVPVQSIKPALNGTVDIHYRNSMGMGQFITLPQSVLVEPSNASYKNDVTVTSSNTDIVTYDGSGYTPYRNGTVTLTAKLKENGRVVKGTSEVTFVYTNPLSEVVAPAETIVMDQGAKQPLPLTFKGQPGNRHEITEPDMVWSFSKRGIVSIQRPDNLMQVRETGGPDDGNWVASNRFEVRALRPGTVTVTGTPVDTTGGAHPVTFTVTVNSNGTPVQGFDIPKFIAEGKQAASNYLNAHNGFSFGEEWTIATLLRAGQTLPQEKLDSYYQDVVTNVHKWNNTILPTEVERTAVALNMMGKDITDVDGVDLVPLICNHPDLTKQGSNAIAWALIALDMNNTPIPENMKWSRQSLVKELLSYQNEDGGFGLDKTDSSGIDMTAMSVQALARYQTKPEVAAAVEKAVGYLAAATEKNLNLGNAESISQIVLTLGVLNRDVTAEPNFGDEIENILSVLSEYMVEGQGFKHDKNGGLDNMASAQAMQALCAYERFLNGESGYWDLQGTGPIVDPVDKVMEMIAALPDEVTAAHAEAVQAARDAYEDLTLTQKDRVTNLDKLLRAEKSLADVKAVQQGIDNLPTEITLADAYTIQQTRAAYDRLTAAEQAQITGVEKLEAAEEALKLLVSAEGVKQMIDALPEEITLANEKDVRAARSAYEMLTAEQKAHITNLSKLEQAEQKLDELISAQQVQQVVDIIAALPESVTEQDEAAVRAARAAFAQLTEQQQAQVANLSKLEQAEKSIADQKAAAKVDSAILGLPHPVSLADKQAVQDVRNAYDALSADQQALVKNLDKLTQAENDLADLDAAQQVMAMIKALPNPATAADQQAVQAARKAYQALTERQQLLVLNLYILERAEQTVAEETAVQDVENAIAALPENVTEADAAAVSAARDAYNKLTPELRARVENLNKLTKAEKALQEQQRPIAKPTRVTVTESNVVDAVVENGVVSAQQLAAIKDQEKVLRIEGKMETGEAYVLSIYGKDIVKVKDFVMGIQRKGQYEEDIHVLSEEPEIFRFLESGAFPAPVMVEMDTQLADGEYLLLRYDPAQQRADLVSRVKAANGKVQFIAEQGGEYFLAKKASKKSVPELKQDEQLPEEPQDVQETVSAAEEVEQTAPQEPQNINMVWIWVPCLILVIAGAAIACKKRKENKGE